MKRLVLALGVMILTGSLVTACDEMSKGNQPKVVLLCGQVKEIVQKKKNSKLEHIIAVIETKWGQTCDLRFRAV